MAAPKVVIVAGPNGAGKTTFAQAFLPGEAPCPHFINADAIAAGLSAFAPEAAAVRAGRVMLAEIVCRRYLRPAKVVSNAKLSPRAAQASSLSRGWRSEYVKVDITCLKQ